MKPQKDKVIFRKHKDSGEVFALFPEHPGTYDAITCSCYAQCGQHSAADTRIVANTSLASKAEYNYLKKELMQIGYNLQICSRIHRNAFDIRRQKISKTYRNVL